MIMPYLRLVLQQITLGIRQEITQMFVVVTLTEQTCLFGWTILFILWVIVYGDPIGLLAKLEVKTIP